MDFNGRNFDIDKAMQDIALEYAKTNLQNQEIDQYNAKACITNLVENYFQTLGYLSTLNNEYIKCLMERGSTL